MKSALRLLALALLANAVAPAPASAALTATSGGIGSHPAYVRVVVQFSGGTVRFNETMAVDPSPFDGTARVEVQRAGIQVPAPIDRSAFGVRARVTQGAGRAIVRLTGAARRFKYVRVTVLAAPQRLVIDLYRSRPPVAGAEIRTAPGGCLSLTSVIPDGRGFRVSGGEKDLFEHNFLLRVRDASGRSIARRIVTSDGPWSARVTYRVSRAQAGTIEAVADSAKDGSLVCLAQRRVNLRP